MCDTRYSHSNRDLAGWQGVCRHLAASWQALLGSTPGRMHPAWEALRGCHVAQHLVPQTPGHPLSELSKDLAQVNWAKASAHSLFTILVQGLKLTGMNSWSC